jgi:hypothetical protein
VVCKSMLNLMSPQDVSFSWPPLYSRYFSDRLNGSVLISWSFRRLSSMGFV